MDIQSNKNVLRQKLLDLNAERKKKEQEILLYQEILRSQNVGMTDSLVDKDNFPRNDVDVYQIRFARNKIICLENDCKSIMKQIEGNLYSLHSLSSIEEKPSQPTPPYR